MTSRKSHIFQPNVPADVGVVGALLFNGICGWVEHNRAVGRHDKNRHYVNGEFWTYGSVASMQEEYPYITTSMVRTGLKKLEDRGFIETGQFNRAGYDKTTWYRPTGRVVADLSISVNGNYTDSDDKVNLAIADELGVTAAAIFPVIWEAILYNARNGDTEENAGNFHLGKPWMYHSIQAFHERFPYLGKAAISKALKSLIQAGFLEKGNFTEHSWNKTTSYTAGSRVIADLLKVINGALKSQIHDTNIATPLSENRKPIPDSKIYSKTDTQESTPAKKYINPKSGIHPEAELSDKCFNLANIYFASKGKSHIDPQEEWLKFVSHHRSHGTKMKCWDSAWTTWYMRSVTYDRPQSNSTRRPLFEDMNDRDWAA